MTRRRGRGSRTRRARTRRSTAPSPPARASASAATRWRALTLPAVPPAPRAVCRRVPGPALVTGAVLGGGRSPRAGEISGPPRYGPGPASRQTGGGRRALGRDRLGTSHYAPVEGRSAVDTF